MASSATPPSADRGKSERIPGLDGLRAIAILWVFISHLRFDRAVIPVRSLADLSMRGADGVTLFFVISGFLITTLLLKEEATFGRIRLGDFYLRRGFRILPAATFYLVIVLAVFVAKGGTPAPAEWLGSLLFFRNHVADNASRLTGHFWSLSVEEQFYFLWPAILAFLPGRRRLAATLLLVVLAPLWRHVATKLAAGQPMNIGRLDLIYDALLVGALLAQLQQVPWFRRLFDRIPLMGLFLTLSSGGFLYLCLYPLPLGVIGAISKPTVQLGCAIVALKILVEARSPTATWLLELPTVTWLGRISYSLYLWHVPFVHKWIPDFPGHILVRLILSLAAAWLSYRFIEQPMLRMRQRFIKPSHGSGT